MLYAWIIEQIKRKEREQQERSRPEVRIELPLEPVDIVEDKDPRREGDQPERGVVVIDFSV